jgi:hypothetical protein
LTSAYTLVREEVLVVDNWTFAFNTFSAISTGKTYDDLHHRNHSSDPVPGPIDSNDDGANGDWDTEDQLGGPSSLSAMMFGDCLAFFSIPCCRGGDWS